MLIERFPTPHCERGRRGHAPTGIVVHTNVGSFASTVSWFASPESRVSAHYLIGLDGRVAQFVDEEDTARHAGRVREPTATIVTGENPNLYTIGVEFEDAGDPAEVVRTEEEYTAGAAILRAACDRWQIPADRDHVVGHREIFSAKSCPGNLDVDRLLEVVAT